MIRVAFIYKPSLDLFQNTFANHTHKNFFFHAIKNNKRLQVSYYPEETNIDIMEIKDKTDVILLAENDTIATPNLYNIHRSKIPVISRADNAHFAKDFDRIKAHEKFNISHYFINHPPEYFYQYYPKTFKTKFILYGLASHLYQKITPFENRISNKILNTGHARTYELKLRVYRYLKSLKYGEPDWTIDKHYKLRSICNNLKYVDYVSKKTTEYVRDRYPELLGKYRTSIAATTVFPTLKYLESAAAGCLTFMEITEKNKGSRLGFKDGHSAVFINEDNYKDKFEEYLSDVNNPKWEKIANAGREHTMNHFDNTVIVDQLADLMQEVIQ